MHWRSTCFLKKYLVKKRSIQKNEACPICNSIAISIKSKGCESCGQLYCSFCLEKLQEQSSEITCLSCKNDLKLVGFEKKPIVKQLKKLKFKCKDCKEMMKWNYFMNHYQMICTKKHFDCPLCGMEISKSCDKEQRDYDIYTHTLTCAEAKMRCKNCNRLDFFKNLRGHDCFSKAKESH